MTLIQLFKTIDLFYLHSILFDEMKQHVFMIIPIINLNDGLFHHPFMVIELVADFLPHLKLVKNSVDLIFINIELIVAPRRIVDELELIT